MHSPENDPARAVYGISVAAELVGMEAQSLRLYESRGLLDPARTDGGTRRYSPNDLDRLRRIGDLLADGLNLAGIAVVLQLETENSQLRADLRDSSAPDPADVRPELRASKRRTPAPNPSSGPSKGTSP